MSSQEIRNAINTILDTKGINVLNEPQLFCAMLDDLAPQMNNERNIFRRTLVPYPEISNKLYTLLDLGNPSKEELGKLGYLMRNNYGISDNWVCIIINSFWENSYSVYSDSANGITESRENNCFSSEKEIKSLNNSLKKIKSIIPEIQSGNYQFFVKQDGTVFYSGYETAESYKQVNEEMKAIRKWKNIKDIAICSFYTDQFKDAYVVFGLKTNGTVCMKVISLFDNTVEKEFSTVRQWTDIKKIVTGYEHILALKTDGTVLAAGSNKNGELNVTSWKNIKDIYATTTVSLGLTESGTVLATEGHRYTNIDTSLFQNIQSFGKCDSLVLLITETGNVITAGDSSTYENSKIREIRNWKNIKKVVSDEYIVGLTSDGKVLCVNNKTLKDLSGITSKWENIVDVNTSYSYVVALSSDGKLYVVGSLDKNEPIKAPQKDLERFTDICAFTLLGGYIIALKTDGNIEYINVYGKKYYDYGENDTMTALANFRLFNNADEYLDAKNNQPFWFDTGDSYIGEWKNGKMNGKGTYIWENGEKLIGEFRNNNAFDCEGVFHFKGCKYYGAFVNGKKSGHGKLIHDNGNRYEGEFRDGDMHEGVFYWHDNTQWKGILKNNEPFTGEGTWHFKDGTVKSGKWKNGRKKLFG
ncbi:MAG: hypothetical protein U0L76_01080 [Ruminococcus sp.]|nr:hypothetical protein [Ruminococcus sp.]